MLRATNPRGNPLQLHHQAPLPSSLKMVHYALVRHPGCCQERCWDCWRNTPDRILSANVLVHLPWSYKVFFGIVRWQASPTQLHTLEIPQCTRLALLDGGASCSSMQCQLAAYDFLAGVFSHFDPVAFSNIKLYWVHATLFNASIMAIIGTFA
ncbi:hypothetical protein PHYPSEUDO_006159 [Phytophthora pseudosyringae]|uniref:Uncharacterized protein n=1 Tax=Phytophthora pseudosyringae TaxID=221518 RepID=A0A8T1WFD3_9STRA|nr:hypothetical protein PHYPSEUDO_006159 [Phytophthora pseudosyringae]